MWFHTTSHFTVKAATSGYEVCRLLYTHVWNISSEVPANKKKSTRLCEVYYTLALPCFSFTVSIVCSRVFRTQNKQRQNWSRSCLGCQRRKLLVEYFFDTPYAFPGRVRCPLWPCFPSRRSTSLLTWVDRFSECTYIVPFANCSPEFLACAFAEWRVPLFGSPGLVTIDWGSDFQGSLCSLLNALECKQVRIMTSSGCRQFDRSFS